ncbi:hypothetical protein OP10G_0210 [Fimbriimonas ginsengisoli Gsoil 348]|uniref:Uncharacterized protein n=1 Tax=Fimbriimonas ginsengisoli Gsoil 348 TaxID=661478 RepID=A0A068NJ22_FIMGI|nr:hypothetical protein OP10G_0210 [Fimbriimonas ginsengisoli Gsoil 348]
MDESGTGSLPVCISGGSPEQYEFHAQAARDTHGRAARATAEWEEYEEIAA